MKEVVVVDLITTVKFFLLDVDKPQDDRMLASCQVTDWEQLGGWVQLVHVNPNCRRQGYGRLLLQEMLAYAREADKTGLGLAVRKHNKAAYQLYKSLGFVGCYVHGQDIIMTIHLGHQEGGQGSG
ncbi:hypothetical protein BXP70_27795 [Hymenobacter crusticola]|uniref:N-acetyltransferase domain-containing protein n=2 Tax=Hymenobacter crusticola TaxID=1770526 RepID=A0A243W5F0_9BACT|nr:hypothetical protein BXP70_27795 [Hymenobacter crusticola]